MTAATFYPLAVLILLTLELFGISFCAKLLFLPMHMTGSHKKSMVPLADALADRGHFVTFWNTFFEAMPIKPANPNIVDHDLVTTTSNQMYNEQWVWHNGTDIMGAWNSRELQNWDELLIQYVAADICKHAVDQYWDQIDGLINEPWDLMVVDTLFSPCGFLISQRSKVPKVLLSTSYSIPQTNNHLAVPQPIDSSLANTIDYRFSNFWHRAKQFSIWYLYDYVNTKIVQLIYQWLLAGALPTSFDWKSFDQDSMHTFHSFPTIVDYPKPSLPDFFSFGDAPCPQAPEVSLPEDYRTFVEDDNSRGTIIAAFGHIVNWKIAPMLDIMELHGAFARMKNYRFIWQYNGDPLPPLPNVKLSTWFPQRELLSHNKTKAFISHMGLKSMMEGMCAEVPFVALPVYAEQPFNARLMINRHKTGTLLDKKALNTADIVNQLTEVLENPAYKKRISALRSMMIDKPMNPLEEAAFRIDFVLKHPGSVGLLQIRGRFMNILTYYNIDIMAAVILIVILGVVLVKKVLRIAFLEHR